MRKMTVALTSMVVCCAMSGAGWVSPTVRGAKPGTGKRMEAKMIDRSKKQSSDAVEIADGVWKSKPGGLFGKKFGEKIPDQTTLKRDRARGESYVSFQPEKRFRSFADYRLIVDPRTRLVYGISCVAKVKGKDACAKEVAELKDILRQKFPKAFSSGKMIGYYEGGEGWVGAHWEIAIEEKHPGGQSMSPSEITIRAIDEHFFPPEQPAKPDSSPDVDVL